MAAHVASITISVKETTKKNWQNFVVNHKFITFLVLQIKKARDADKNAAGVNPMATTVTNASGTTTTAAVDKKNNNNNNNHCSSNRNSSKDKSKEMQTNGGKTNWKVIKRKCNKILSYAHTHTHT